MCPEMSKAQKYILFCLPVQIVASFYLRTIHWLVKMTHASRSVTPIWPISITRSLLHCHCCQTVRGWLKSPNLDFWLPWLQKSALDGINAWLNKLLAISRSSDWGVSMARSEHIGWIIYYWRMWASHLSDF